jgi:hypothetical protein
VKRPALCAALLALGACRAPAPRQSVDRVVVAETEGTQRLEGAGVGRDEVLRVALEALRGSRTFGPPAPEGAAARRWLGRVAVHRAEATGGAAGPSAHVVLTLELSPQESGGTLRETARAVEPVGTGPRALREAFSRATAGALERRWAASPCPGRGAKAEDELLADLGAPDARVRDCAVRVLADRKSRAAVPALVERLADPDPEVVERAIGALGQIGDAAAVPSLVRLAQRRQGPSVAHLARIIGDVGGPDARSYLLTLASGHADPLVRAAAQQALDEMEARAAEVALPARP